MANTITGINDDIIAQTALNAFVAKMTPITAFANSFSAEAARKGDTISVMTVSASTAATTKTTETAYTIQAADASAIEVSLGQPTYVSWGLDDVQRASSSVLNMERFGMQKGFALAKAVLQGIWAYVTNANYGAAVWTDVAANFDTDDVITILNACDAANMPDEMRSLIVGPTYYNQLLGDTGIIDASAYGSTDPVRMAKIPNLYGFNIYKSNLIPANGENLVGMACHPDGLAVAMRYLQPGQGNKYSDARPLTDPESGMTIGVRSWYDESVGMEKRVLECVWGAAVGVSAGLKRLTSA